MKNNGVDAEKTFVERWETRYGKEVYVEKLTDTKSMRRTTGGFQVQAPSVPSDYIVTLKGEMWYAEVKSCSNKTSFPFSQFTKSQRAAMVKQRAAGGRYMVYIYNTNTGEWYEVSGPVLLDMEKETNCKSIKWEEMAGTRWLI